MSNTTIIRNGVIINRGERQEADIYVEDGRIAQIDGEIDQNATIELDADGMYVLPGIIDDQVHFREPGYTHKAEIYTEARAAVAGGVTSYMEMPNTKPPTLTQKLLEKKYMTAAGRSLANYSFFMGAGNDNFEEVMKTNPEQVCGVKVFMGSSTGNMLVDNYTTLEKLFSNVPMLIATHCEDEETIRTNLALWQKKFPNGIPFDQHPEIRSVEACYKSSSLAIDLAKKFGTRLHILHISTAKELELFSNAIPLTEKRITSEVCVHHLHFTADDYAKLGSRIKCNPAIKASENKAALWEALLDDTLDIIATDHAPHTKEEKGKGYMKAPSGLPLVQHSLVMMYQQVLSGRISMEKIVEKMCHAPAQCFRVKERGFLDEGKWADIVLFDPDEEWTVKPKKIYYKCKWSPLEGMPLKGKVHATMVSGHLAYLDGLFLEEKKGERLEFEPLDSVN